MPRLPGKTVEEKLLLNHRREGTCWRWTGAHMRKGYGQLKTEGKVRSVHQLAYVSWVGDIPAGHEIDHTCNVRDCINPAHLEVVTHQENHRRRILRRTHCPHGHELTGDNIKIRKKRGGESVSCRRCWNAGRRANAARKRERQEDA